MSDYMDTPHYRVNKYVSVLRVLGGSDRHGRIHVVNDIPLTLDDLEAVVRQAAASTDYAEALKEDFRNALAHWESTIGLLRAARTKAGDTNDDFAAWEVALLDSYLDRHFEGAPKTESEIVRPQADALRRCELFLQVPAQPESTYGTARESYAQERAETLVQIRKALALRPHPARCTNSDPRAALCEFCGGDLPQTGPAVGNPQTEWRTKAFRFQTYLRRVYSAAIGEPGDFAEKVLAIVVEGIDAKPDELMACDVLSQGLLPERLSPESRLWKTMNAKPPAPNTRVRVAFEDETQGTAVWTGSGWTDVLPSAGQAFIAWAPLQSIPAQVRVEEPKA